MELVEVRFENDGQDPFPMFMSRHRCPKNRDDIEPDFPLGAMEITDEEVKEYFSPVDLSIGKTLVIYGRRFLVYDVDNFTKAFYWKNFGMTDFTPVDVDIPKPPLPKQVPVSQPASQLLWHQQRLFTARKLNLSPVLNTCIPLRAFTANCSLV